MKNSLPTVLIVAYEPGHDRNNTGALAARRCVARYTTAYSNVNTSI